MAENDEPEISRKVTVQQVSTSGTTKNSAPVIIAIVVIAIILVAFIFMQMT